MPDYDLAKLRADVRELEHRLEDVDKAEEAFKEYVGRLRPIVEAYASRKRVSDITALWALAEDERLAASPLIRAVDPVLLRAGPLRDLLRPNLRAARGELLNHFGAPGHSGVTVGPVEYDRFQAKVGESLKRLENERQQFKLMLRQKAILLEEAERVDAERSEAEAHAALMVAPEPKLAPVIKKWVQQAKSNRVVRGLWWAFEGPAEAFISAVVLAALAALVALLF